MRRTFVLLTVLLCLIHPLAATVLVPVDFKDVVGGSQIIVYGRVVDVRAEWAPDRSQIESVVTIAPVQFYRGSTAPSVRWPRMLAFDVSVGGPSALSDAETA